MTNLKGLCLALALALAAGGAVAKGKPAKHTKAPDATADRAEVLIDVVFTTVERRVIEEFFGRQAVAPADQGGKGGKGLPPGLAKRDTLPPGLAKRDMLPPGLAKRALPGDLTGQLGAPRTGTERVIVGNDVLLVEAATGLVLDILYDVVTSN